MFPSVPPAPVAVLESRSPPLSDAPAGAPDLSSTTTTTTTRTVSAHAPGSGARARADAEIQMASRMAVSSGVGSAIPSTAPGVDLDWPLSSSAPLGSPAALEPPPSALSDGLLASPARGSLRGAERAYPALSPLAPLSPAAAVDLVAPLAPDALQQHGPVSPLAPDSPLDRAPGSPLSMSALLRVDLDALVEGDPVCYLLRERINELLRQLASVEQEQQAIQTSLRASVQSL